MRGGTGQNEAGKNRVIDEVARLLKLARSRGASDLHLEPTAGGLSVRLRLDGVLHDVETLPADFARPVIARLKLLADLLTYRTDIPQEGRLRSEDAGGLGDLRVSTFPTVHGERAVVRFFDPGSMGTFELEGLNLPPAVLDGLRRAVSGTSGVVLLSGPAGSGKTTTLYAAVNDILKRRPHRPHVITVEDPIESLLEGVTQTQVNEASGLTYAAALRSLLRQDPEVVMVGEIRDRETAEIVAQAGLTGHLVLSTLHGGDVATVLTRLTDMGLEPYVVTSSLKAVLAMRLVRRLCEGCRREGPRLSLHVGGRTLSVGSFEPVGCGECGGTGFRGRLPIAEFTPVSAELKKRILALADSDVISARLREEGMHTLFEGGVDRLEAGLTSLAELERVLGPAPLAQNS